MSSMAFEKSNSTNRKNANKSKEKISTVAAERHPLSFAIQRKTSKSNPLLGVFE